MALIYYTLLARCPLWAWPQAWEWSILDSRGKQNLPEAVPEGYVGKFGLEANPKTMSRKLSGEESTGTRGG